MKKVKIILLILFLISFSFCIYKIFRFIKEDKAAENLKDELIEIVDIPEIPSEDPQTVINFDELKKVNSDVVGWIIIEGTQINYPIVKGENNSYYLKHNYKKEYSGYGSIFMDFTAKDDFTSLNTFIYGHYTSNKSMFGELGNFMSQEFFDSHKNIFIYTPTNNYKIEVFSVHVDNALSDSYLMNFITKDEYKNYIDLMIEKSVIKSNVEIDYTKDKIITLYSCSRETNYKKQDRYFIHGKVIDLNENYN